MLIGVDLGVALLLLLLALLIRSRWRKEAARKEEVRRLMLLAAVEEQRAEREAAFIFVPTAPAAPAFASAAPRPAAVAVAKAPPPPPPLVCASCSSPATARCARCKAVRYCSGKCQIIHWRQGHKDECYPPSAAPEELLNPKITKNLSEGATASILPDALDEGNAPRDKIYNYASLKEKDSHTGINASAYEGLTPSLSRATSDASASVEPLISEDAGFGKSSSGSSSTSVRIAVDVSGDKTTKDPIPVVGTGVSEENTIKAHGSVGVISSDFETKMSTASRVSKSTSQLERTEKLVFDANDSDAVAVESLNDMLLRNKKISRSSSASGSNQFSSDGVRSTVFHKSSEVARASIRSTSIDSSGFNGMPSSVNQIGTQLPASKISREYSSELMLFPYDIFVKLCNNKVGYYPCGLTNCGNSCYANVVLQCLSFTRPLTTYLYEGLHSRTCPKKEWCFTCELERLFMSSKKGISPLSPIGILSHLEDIGSSFGRGKQEDAHEFLRYAIDAMQSVCLKETGARPGEPLAEETTLIQQTFGGYLKSKIKCGRCKGKSERSERMMDLAVEIDGDIDSIEEALERFTSIETLDGENKYKCNRCKSYERAHKSLKISEAPNVLTIALKRFQSGKFGKLNKVVRFDQLLNLAPYMHETDDNTPIYGLYAVVVHIDEMNSTSSGHYVCYVKDNQGKWYKIDDSKVKPVELTEVLSMNAYILFYARYSPRAPRLVRKARTYEVLKGSRTRNKEDKGKPNLESRQSSPSVSLSQHNLRQRNVYDPANSQASFLFDGRHSDSSSLFSSSDGGSSTDSTKGSTTSDESSCSPLGASEDSDGTIDSPWSLRHSSDTFDSGEASDSYRTSDSSLSTSSSGWGGDEKTEAARKNYIKPSETGGAGFEGKGSPSFLYADNSKQFRHLTENYRTRETDWINTKAKPGVVSRRPTREATAQTFY